MNTVISSSNMGRILRSNLRIRVRRLEGAPMRNPGWSEA